MAFRLLVIFVLVASFQRNDDPVLVVLGIAQDAGYPQIGCYRDCCRKYWDKKLPKQRVTSLVLVDPATRQKWLFDATPDIAEQLNAAGRIPKGDLSGIFLTHAHMGHYTGLMYLGREALNATGVPVYVMPRMHDYLRTNGPWDQLVSLNNIELKRLKADTVITLSNDISVTPIPVPHRDEYSETVGYIIRTAKRRVLFVPDIDKWSKWEKDIKQLVTEFDYLFIDGTFYDEGELPGRNINEVPHPFIKESVELFTGLPASEKRKIFFIHFNHTNPLIDQSTAEYKEVKSKGFNVAAEGLTISL